MTLCKCGCGQEIIIIKKYHKWQRIPEYIKGHYHPSNETKKKISQTLSGERCYNYGKHLSEETKKKLSEASKGKHHSEESKNKMSKACNGRKHSEETKKKLSEINRGKKHSEESKLKMSNNQPKMLGENNPSWKGGISFLPYCPKFNEKKKEEVREQYNRKCIVCGLDEKDNITKNGKHKKLSVHHIDADKEQGCNGKKWNLKPLCMYCHSKITRKN